MKVKKFFWFFMFSALLASLAGCSAARSAGEAFIGEWTTDDPAVQFIPKIIIQREGDALTLQVWGACIPENCYWNDMATYEMTNVTDSTLTSVWNFSFAEETLTLTLLEDGRLHALFNFHVLNDPLRSDVESEGYFYKVH